MKRFLLPIVTLVGMCLVTGCDGALPSGGVSTRDNITQREITREQAKVVSTDIAAKQESEFGSSSSAGLGFSAVNPVAKRANDNTSNYSGWEYGSEYDWDDDYEGANYQDNWSYQKQQGEDQWGYKEGDDYNTWYQNRASQKTFKMPSAATFDIYAKTNNIDISRNYQEVVDAQMRLEYDFDNYYIHINIDEKMDTNSNSTSSNTEDGNLGIDMWLYYKDGHFIIANSYNGEVKVQSDFAVGTDGAAAYFNNTRKQFDSYIGRIVGGSSYLEFVDMFKEAGFDCKYGSNDAGNLEMIIKGKDVSDMSALGMTEDNVTVNFDGSFVWDQYCLRCMELHLAAASNTTIMEQHAKLTFADGCTPTYPSIA